MIEYAKHILVFSSMFAFGVISFVMAIGGVRTRNVYFVSTRPPIALKSRPVSFVIWTAILFALSFLCFTTVFSILKELMER